MPDYLRLIALFGIVIVNVQYFAYPSSLDGFKAWLDPNKLSQTAIILVSGLATMKTYGLFSFMFGVGLAFQIRSAQRANVSFRARYWRRMMGLAILGILHGIFFFYGDILLLYALTGSVLYFWRDWPVRRLLWAAGIFIALQIICTVPLFFFPSDVDPAFLALEQAIFQDSNFWQIAQLRGNIYGAFVILQLILQGLSALGWFALGLAAVKSGMIDNPNHPIWRLSRRLFLFPGIAFSLWGAGLTALASTVFYQNLGWAIIVIFAPIATLGYLGLIAKISRPPQGVIASFLKAGGSSLTIYLGQSILLSLFFCGYGFGFFMMLSPLMIILVSIAVTILLIIFVLLWRQYFSQGPFEILLQRITYIGERKHHA